MSRLRKLLRWPVLGLLALTLLAEGRDALHLSPAQEAAAPYLYDLVQWQAANFLSKWVHRLATAWPWSSPSEEQRQGELAEYFRLGEQVDRLQSELKEAAARPVGGARARLGELESELKQVRASRLRLRNGVEETLEGAISAVLSEEDIASWGELIFPPVDIRLSEPPKLLVTSPRDRILRTHDVLLDPNVEVPLMEQVEGQLLRGSNLSALVVDLGGLATYPASLLNDQPLLWTLQTSAHEWLHHYLFFRPLGQSMFKSPDLQSLNETVADMAGREIGARAFRRLGGTPPPTSAGEPEADAGGQSAGSFSLEREMRKTRLRVDELLAKGKVEEAEGYMEQRRLFFAENGAYIRKLNQAYFAFHGTYAESAASVSPIAGQLRRYRNLVPDLGGFIKSLSGVSSYPKFLDELERLEAKAR